MGPLEGVALSTDANQCCVVTQLPDAIQSHFLGALDVHSRTCCLRASAVPFLVAATCPATAICVCFSVTYPMPFTHLLQLYSSQLIR